MDRSHMLDIRSPAGFVKSCDPKPEHFLSNGEMLSASSRQPQSLNTTLTHPNVATNFSLQASSAMCQKLEQADRVVTDVERRESLISQV